jgi:hypothetical protein
VTGRRQAVALVPASSRIATAPANRQRNELDARAFLGSTRILPRQHRTIGRDGALEGECHEDFDF